MIAEPELVRRFPSVPWRDPIRIRVTSGATGLGCRICIAQRGLKASEVGGVSQTAAEHARHLAEAHR